MLNQKINDSIKIAKELYKHSIINDDEYAENELMKIIVTLSGITDKKLEISNRGTVLTEDSEIERVHRRVPKWIKKPLQINTMILNKYMEISANNENPVVLQTLEEAVGLDSRKFFTNYTQMKIIAEKNHAKVFREEDGIVYLWEPVADFIVGLYDSIDNKVLDAVYKKNGN
jgi:hypothetical protein